MPKPGLNIDIHNFDHDNLYHIDYQDDDHIYNSASSLPRSRCVLLTILSLLDIDHLDHFHFHNNNHDHFQLSYVNLMPESSTVHR